MKRPILMLLLFTPIPSGLATLADNRQPIEINGCNYTQLESRLTFERCFSLSQGSRKITSESAVVVRGPNDSFSRVELRGSPATWDELGEDGLPFSAQATQIDYDVAGQTITLQGDVFIKQGQREITSQTMRYDLRSGAVSGGDADDPNSRVRLVFPPPPSEQAEDSPPPPSDSDPAGIEP